MPEIKVEGARELRSSLRRVSKEYPKEMKAIHEKVAEPVATLARSKSRRKSGKMAGTTRTSATQTMARVAQGGYGVVYAGVQEWGWPGHGIAPSHALTDSLAEREQQTLDTYLTLTDQFIDRVWETI